MKPPGWPLDRRSFLAVATGTAVSLAGCFDSGSNVDANGNGDGDGTSGDGLHDTSTGFTDTWEIEPNDFESHLFSLNAGGLLSYEATVTSGPALDFALFSAIEYESYRNDPQFQVMTEGTVFDTRSATIETDLPTGSYAFVVDYTNKVKARPPDGGQTATVDVTLDIETNE